MEPSAFWWTCFVVLCALTILKPVDADFHCLCSYAGAEPVLKLPDADSTVLGYLSMFDCKPLASPVPQQNYFPIQFQKLLAFVLSSERISVQECAGSPSEQDLIHVVTVNISGPQQQTTHPALTTVPTTTIHQSTTIPTTVPTTRHTTTHATTPVPTAVSTVKQTSATVITECPTGWLDFGTSCYLLSDITNHFTWNESNVICSNHNAHLVFINDAAEKDFIEKQLPSGHGHQTANIWLGAMYTTGWNWEDPKLGTQSLVNTDLVPITQGLHPNVHLEAGNSCGGMVAAHHGVNYSFRHCQETNGYICEITRSNPIVGR